MESSKNIVANSFAISQNPLKTDESYDDYSLSHVVQLGGRRKADATANKDGTATDQRYCGDYEGFLPGKPPNFQPRKVLRRGNSSSVTQDINWVVGELRKAQEGSRADNIAMAAPNNIQQDNERKELQNKISDDGYLTGASKKRNGLFTGVYSKAAGVSRSPSLKNRQVLSRFGRSAAESSSSSASLSLSLKQPSIHQQQPNPIPNYFHFPPNPNYSYNDHQITFPAAPQQNPTSDEYSEEEVAWLKQILLSPDRDDDQNV